MAKQHYSLAAAPHCQAGQTTEQNFLKLTSPIWYRIWSSHRIKQLAPWFKQVMPEEQHGCLQGKGIHTALIPNLAAIEANLRNTDQAEDYRFVGGADLSKAFDRLAWKHSTAAMQRMGIPAGINNALAAAWRQQQRWLTTANYVSNRPYPAQCLPQGDSASPIGLWLLCLKPTEESELLTLKINMGHNGIPFSLTTDFGSLREQALASQLQERGNKLLPSSILEKTLAKLTSMRLDAKTMLRRCRTPSPSWSPRNHQTKDANLGYIHTTQLQSKRTYR